MKIQEAENVVDGFIGNLKQYPVAKWSDLKFPPDDDGIIHERYWYAVWPLDRLNNIWDTGFTKQSGRFGVKSPMMYLSTSPVNPFQETDESYRTSPENYNMDDSWNALMNSKAPVVEVKIPNNFCFFDVRHDGSGKWLANALRIIDYSFNISELVVALHHPIESIYNKTRLLSQLVKDNGFDGIIYNPVRQPSKPVTVDDSGDLSGGGIWVADNLALFSRPHQCHLLTYIDALGIDEEYLDKCLTYTSRKWAQNA